MSLLSDINKIILVATLMYVSLVRWKVKDHKHSVTNWV